MIILENNEIKLKKLSRRSSTNMRAEEEKDSIFFGIVLSALVWV